VISSVGIDQQASPQDEMIWNIRSSTLTLERPLIMGIVNLTPDSFYDGGHFFKPTNAVDHALRLIQDGANLLDLGAESTRPNAAAVPEDEELRRLIPVLSELLQKTDVPISIDTTKAAVAKCALEAGASIVNDVSGLKDDPEMARVVSKFEAGVVLMHRRGHAQNMQSQTQYDDVVNDVGRELAACSVIAERAGIRSDNIVFDPGIGFAKTPEQNLELIERLQELERFKRPILVGPSRKAFIGVVTGREPADRLFGTISACVLAFERGARIFRVHDVRETRDALLVAEAVVETKKEISV
jgi:dihydropteroate synthase